MTDLTLIQTIIQGGAVGISLALVWLVYKLSKSYYNHTNDVIERNSKAMNNLAESHQKLTDVIDRWHEKKKR